jgi:Mitochondrial carrier protein
MRPDRRLGAVFFRTNQKSSNNRLPPLLSFLVVVVAVVVCFEQQRETMSSNSISTSNSSSRQHHHHPEQQQQPHLGFTDVSRRMLCGGLAGMVAKTATSPLERIKMLSQTGEHGAASRSIIAIYRHIIQTEGLWGLWAGNGANLLRVFPSKAVVFSSNDVYRKWLTTTVHMDPTSASFLAGGLAGMTATATTYPLDLVRGRISGKVAADKAYTSVYRTVRLTIRDEGVRGLYKGLIPTMIGALPYVGIQFGTVGVLERQFPPVYDNNDTTMIPSPWRKTLFGGLGGVMAGLVTYPNDTVRRLLQLQGSRGTIVVYQGYWDCVSQTVRQHGIARLYRGLGINLIRMAPNSAVQFGSYEFFKTLTTTR